MMWFAAVFLIGVYIFPLWTIDLKAPQYPDGLGIYIWVSKITGRKPHDLQNINGLNHYIGMKAIEPDQIPELKYMKYVSALLILFAGAVALARRRWLLAAFVFVAIGLAAVGMYDFWKWEYDYGHDLDPSAAIKVPGMSYQPPMFGTKQLLNFTTTAWPGIGGWLAMVAVGLSVLALVKELFLRGGNRSGGAKAAVFAAAAIALPLMGCSKGPKPIEYGTDGCNFCRMTIVRFRRMPGQRCISGRRDFGNRRAGCIRDRFSSAQHTDRCHNGGVSAQQRAGQPDGNELDGVFFGKRSVETHKRARRICNGLE
jgi:copper chaperone NosL